MAAFNILVYFLTKILLDNGNFAKVLPRILIRLELAESLGEDVECRVFRVGDKEGHVYEVVRIGEVAEMREEHRQVGLSIS